MKVLAMNGSPRKNGNTQILIGAAAMEIRREGIEVESISLADYDIRPCIACDRCARNPGTAPSRTMQSRY